MMPALLTIARDEAAQLRRHPVRLWPLIAQETQARRLLYLAHGRLVPVTPANHPKNMRL